MLAYKPSTTTVAVVTRPYSASADADGQTTLRWLTFWVFVMSSAG